MPVLKNSQTIIVPEYHQMEHAKNHRKAPLVNMENEWKTLLSIDYAHVRKAINPLGHSGTV